MPGTPIYRKVLKKIYGGRRNLNNLLYHTSLLKVDGFKGPEEFEKFVNEMNIKANLLIKKNSPERFELKYGKEFRENSLMK